MNKSLILTFRKPRSQPWRPYQLLLFHCQEPCSRLSLLTGRSYRCDSHKARTFHQWSSRGLTFRKPSCLLFWLPDLKGFWVDSSQTLSCPRHTPFHAQWPDHVICGWTTAINGLGIKLLPRFSKISWLVSVEHINYLSKTQVSSKNWSDSDKSWYLAITELTT